MELPEEVKIFLVESHENLDKIEEDLILLEKNPQDNAILNSVFRSIHTIKGNSGFLGFPKLETVCHKGETVLHRLRVGDLKLNSSPEITSTLLEMLDVIRSLLREIEDQGVEGVSNCEVVITKLAKYIS